jgi:hypothetical protein
VLALELVDDLRPGKLVHGEGISIRAYREQHWCAERVGGDLPLPGDDRRQRAGVLIELVA